ncbi:MAG: hypothetical protein KKE44_11535 [Proteobacteria bacterium]|nr:hypothetical protein [Pseudomonadota bacterium]MBU1583355.1 hypothetical protein [Pseudomonadota bacterium]MBU2453139.1 hypothetical protein [Pseudomonadota bacterium]MBU2627845.1 hypothetical protein [Pseudomonadota bacterium]
MTKKQQEHFDSKSFLSAWMQSVNDFNGMMKDFAPDFNPLGTGFGPSFEAFGPGTKKAADSISSAYKVWQTLFCFLKDPDMMNAMTSGMNALPEVGLKMARISWETCFKLQQQYANKLASLGKTTQAYPFDDIDQNIYKVWAEIYDKELSKVYKLPKLGLARQYQERFSSLLDKYNLFQTAAAEFSRVLSLPLEKSVQVMQEKFDEISQSDNIPDNPQEYYRLWIKVLEGFYMTLFKSPDYLDAMRNALKTMTEFNTARHETLQDLIQMLPIPSNKDMDELYKEQYLLVKKIKRMEKRLKVLEKKEQ